MEFIKKKPLKTILTLQSSQSDVLKVFGYYAQFFTTLCWPFFFYTFLFSVLIKLKKKTKTPALMCCCVCVCLPVCQLVYL